MKESITQKLDINSVEATRGLRSGLDSASAIQEPKPEQEGEKKEEATPLFQIGNEGHQGNPQDEKDETPE